MALEIGGYFGLKWYFKSTPQKTVRSFYKAFEERDFQKMALYLEPEVRDKFKPALNILEQTVTDVEFSNFKLQTLSQNNQEAKVKLEADMRISFAHVKQNAHLDMIVNLVFKDQRWYLVELPVKEEK